MFSYCKFLSYIYVFIYFFVFRKTMCAHGECWGLVMAVFSPAMPWLLLPQQGVEGIWDCCLLSHFGQCCCGVGLFSELTDLLTGSLAQPVCVQGPRGVMVRSFAVFSWCPALLLLRSPSTLPDGPAVVSSSAPPSLRTSRPHLLKRHSLKIMGE